MLFVIPFIILASATDDMIYGMVQVSATLSFLFLSFLDTGLGRSELDHLSRFRGAERIMLSTLNNNCGAR